jgi:hypothetical protein
MDARRRGLYRTVVPLALAASCAGGLALAPALMGTRDAAGDVLRLARVEGAVSSHAYRHAETAAGRKRNKAQLRLCRRAAYRARHWATCPSSSGPLVAAAGEMRSFAEDGPESIGRWAPKFGVPSLAINSVVLDTGKVLWFSRTPQNQGGNSHLYDPATGTVTKVPIPEVTYPDGEVREANIWCGGQTVLPDGRVLVAGGNLSYPWGDKDPVEGRGFKGAAWVFIFDPQTETWSRLTHPDGTPWDMVEGRWYPTLTSLSDGRVLIMAGWDESGYQRNVRDVEVFTPRATPDGQDTLATVTQLPDSRPWVNLYPHVFLLPSTTVAGAGPADRVLVAGPGTADATVLHTEDWSWHALKNKAGRARFFGTAVMEQGGPDGPTRVTLVAGSDTEKSPTAPERTATTESLDLNDPGFAAATPSPAWTTGPSLNHARGHLNTVLLPDGGILATGGGLGQAPDGNMYADPVYESELLDRGATAWRDVAKEDDARTYHSTAVLLPDGRVLSAGDDRQDHVPPPQGFGSPTAQIYSPPYLFHGPRPTVTGAPASVRYGDTFRVTTGGTAVSRVVLMHPGAVTHANDMDQRSFELRMTADADGLTLTAPRDGTIAPPGPYMLFALSADGTPSAARWIRVEPRLPEPAAPAAPATIPPASSGGVTPATDSRAPVLRVRALHEGRRRGTVVVRVRLQSDEAATLTARLSGGRAVTARLARGRARDVLVKAARRPGDAPTRLALSLRAVDAVGNATTVRRQVGPPGSGSPRLSAAVKARR